MVSVEKRAPLREQLRASQAAGSGCAPMAGAGAGEVGLEVETWSELPQGSGLGGSSILGAAILAALWRLVGRSASHDDIIHAVCHLYEYKCHTKYLYNIVCEYMYSHSTCRILVGEFTSNTVSVQFMNEFYETTGLTLTHERISTRTRVHELIVLQVLNVEQLMTTGGGWQDQVGAVYGGVKLGHSGATLPLRVYTDYIGQASASASPSASSSSGDATMSNTPAEFRMPKAQLSPAQAASLADFDRRLVLIYTGKTRLARNLLQVMMTQRLMINHLLCNL